MRILLLSLLVCFALLAADGATPRAHSWRVARTPGSARLSMEAIDAIVLPEGTQAELTEAAEDLRDLFVRRYGVSPGILTRSGRPRRAIILELSDRKWLKANPGAFTMYRERTRVCIEAASAEGLSNGVYAFCEDVLGARWYWEGEIGFEFVGDAPEKFPERRWREAPAFVMRTLYPAENDFGRRNRLVRRYQFNHALAKVFTPELYEMEPEVFAQINGPRRKPKGSGSVDPQPDFTDPRAVELAAEAALAHFEAHPESRSFSLSVNDNALFDESASTEAAVTPLTYFRERPNYTDLVFGFMNAVAAKVFDEAGAWETPEGEPRYLTALAYYWTEQSPSFPLHPRVMPVLTSDRAQWHDPDYRAEDKALIRRWANSGAERIGTWDYYFGAPYPYPRQFHHWIAESLAYLSEHGVTVFFSQLPNAWGLDGGKAWLATRLLWDPTGDAEALLDEYYSHFFGAAAEPMRIFYDMAEAHRNISEGEAEWIKFYKDEAGIELFPEDVLKRMRSRIEAARALVASDSRRLARVAVVSDAFVLTEAYAACHRARQELVDAALKVLAAESPPVSRGEGKRVAGLLNAFVQARQKFEKLGSELVRNPLHRRLNEFLQLRQSDPVPLALAALAMNGTEDTGDVTWVSGADYGDVCTVAETWANRPESFHSMLPNVDLVHAEGAPVKRSFLGPALPSVPGWFLDFRPSEHLAVGAAQLPDGPSAGVRISGADMLSCFTVVPVISGYDYLLDFSAAYRISPDNRTQVRITWTDREGRHLRTDLPFRFPNGEPGGTQRVVIPLRAPDHAYNLRIRFIVSRQYDGDFLELQRVDFGLVKI